MGLTGSNTNQFTKHKSKKKLAKHKSVDQNTNQFIETQMNSSKTVFPKTQNKLNKTLSPTFTPYFLIFNKQNIF